jgi:hypothetical protein
MARTQKRSSSIEIVCDQFRAIVASLRLSGLPNFGTLGQLSLGQLMVPSADQDIGKVLPAMDSPKARNLITTLGFS